MSATDEGRQAAIDGKHHIHNPYKVWTSKHDDWNHGYWKEDDSSALNEDNSDLEADDALIQEMLEALKQADLQIEYMQQKFKETGTGNAVLAQIRDVIMKAQGCTSKSATNT